MNLSTKKNTPANFERLELDNDFFELAVKEKEERQKREEDARKRAAAPKITEEHLAQAESKGYAQGLADGKAQTAEEMQTELHKHLETLTQAFTHIDATKKDYLRLAEGKALQLVQDIISHLVPAAREHLQEDIVKEALHTCLEKAVLGTPLQARVNPHTLDYVQNLEGADEKLSPFKDTLTFVPDDTVDAGDCVLEWETGGVAKRLQGALDEVHHLLSSALAGNHKRDVELPAEESTATAPQAATDAAEKTQTDEPAPDAETKEQQEKPE